MIFRVDDFSAQTNKDDLSRMVEVIKEKFPHSEIIFAVSLLSKFNTIGSVYPHTPFKDMPKHKFFDLDSYIHNLYYSQTNSFSGIQWASHGLLHVDHSKLSYDAQEMSILASCNLINCRIFVPPFNKYNADTIKVCKENVISLVTNDGWKCIEYNPFDKHHLKWYFHPWRWSPEKFREKMNES